MEYSMYLEWPQPKSAWAACTKVGLLKTNQIEPALNTENKHVKNYQFHIATHKKLK